MRFWLLGAAGLERLEQRQDLNRLAQAHVVRQARPRAPVRQTRKPAVTIALIRAQLGALGVPIRGDIKYGSKRTNPDGAIDLHAYKLHFKHPVKEEYMKIIAPLPEDGLWKHVDVELIKSF